MSPLVVGPWPQHANMSTLHLPPPASSWQAREALWGSPAALAHWPLSPQYLRTQELMSHQSRRHPRQAGIGTPRRHGGSSIPTGRIIRPRLCFIHMAAIDTWHRVSINRLHLDGYVHCLLLHRHPRHRPFLQNCPHDLLPHHLP
jgi:hypothetical protein